MSKADARPKDTGTPDNPVFCGDPAIDCLYAMVLVLAQELSVKSERLETLEQLLEQRGLLDRKEIDAYRPEEEEARARLQQHQELIDKLLAPLKQTE